MSNTNVVQLRQAALASAGVRERYKLHPTIAEAACLWSGLSFDVIDECEYESPCIPVIPGRPEVAARASALLEATSHGDLYCTKHIRPGPGGEPADYPEEELERRTIARKDLLAWIAVNFPDEALSQPGVAAQVVVAPAVGVVAAPEPEERLLTRKEVLKMLGVDKSTLYRWINEGTFPEATHKDTRPHRWLLSVVQAHMKTSASKREEDI